MESTKVWFEIRTSYISDSAGKDTNEDSQVKTARSEDDVLFPKQSHTMHPETGFLSYLAKEVQQKIRFTDLSEFYAQLEDF